MEYVYLLNGNPIPYSLRDLRRDNPNVSFSSNPPETLLNSYGVYSVKRLDKPDFNSETHVATMNSQASLVNDEWVYDWTVREKTPEEQAQDIANLEQSLRSKRDLLLASTDWIVTASYERNEPVPEAWATYRQALRDVPQQAGFPTDVLWPTEPGNV